MEDKIHVDPFIAKGYKKKHNANNAAKKYVNWILFSVFEHNFGYV